MPFTSLTSLLSGTSYIALPAAGLVLANSGQMESMPENIKAGLWLLGGLAFLAQLANNVMKMVAVGRGLMGIPMKDGGGTNKPELFVTRKELDDRLTKIENKVDRNNTAHRKELLDMSRTMNTCLRDMTAAISRLEGAVNAS